ncbi:hypothetical protein ZIOFF_025814 [Zingiber officinale]|uniref:Uncharacterized protein n=1 Tax=Zingiber officinale TaxID=94328 RepID=A0A8J5LHG9_ZINOF|nr:hypothetical protein ZIOFF_025814 [Zingiber officinale]
MRRDLDRRCGSPRGRRAESRRLPNFGGESRHWDSTLGGGSRICLNSVEAAGHQAGYRLDPLSVVAISCDTVIIATARVTLYNGLSDLTLVSRAVQPFAMDYPVVEGEGGGRCQHEGREVLFLPISRCSPGPSSAAATSPLLLLLIAWRSLVEFGSPSGNITRKAPLQSVPCRRQWSLSFSPSPSLIAVCSTAATVAAGSHRCLLPRPWPPPAAIAAFSCGHSCRRQPPLPSPTATAAFSHSHSRRRQPSLPFPAATAITDSCSRPLPRLLPLSLVDIVTFQVAAAWYYLVATQSNRRGRTIEYGRDVGSGFGFLAKGKAAEGGSDREISMDDWLRRVYRGDPGVPHTNPDSYVHAWMGSFAIAAVSCCTSASSGLRKHINLDDNAMSMDQNCWRKVMEKKKQDHNSSIILLDLDL